MKWLLLLIISGSITVVAISMFVTQGDRAGPIDSFQDEASEASVPLDAPPVEQPITQADASDGREFQAAEPSAPAEDLVLAGLFGAGSERRAFFEVTRRGATYSSFSLREQEQNEWLQVLSINPQEGTVKAILKRPVVRIRNTGVEVILSFRIHGKKLF